MHSEVVSPFSEAGNTPHELTGLERGLWGQMEMYRERIIQMSLSDEFCMCGVGLWW